MCWRCVVLLCCCVDVLLCACVCLFCWLLVLCSLYRCVVDFLNCCVNALMLRRRFVFSLVCLIYSCLLVCLFVCLLVCLFVC